MKTFIHKLKQFPRLILSITLLSLLVACGGGGGSTSAPTPPSGDATLKSLKLSASDMSSTFASGKLEYTLKTIQSSTTVTAIATDAGASIKVNEKTVASGAASESIPLSSSGETVINVVVTAADGVTTKTYTIKLSQLTALLWTDPDAAKGNMFGSKVVELGNGNIVVHAPGYKTDQGAVHLYSPNSNATIASFRGAKAQDRIKGDQLGNGGIIALANSNFLIVSPDSHLQSGGVIDAAGSVILVNGATGEEIGTTRTGSSMDERFGGNGITLLNDNKFIISSPNYKSNDVTVGAAFLIDGNNGETIKSLYGNDDASFAVTKLGDQGITALGNGNFVIASTQYKSGDYDNAGLVQLLNAEGVVVKSITGQGKKADEKLGSGGITALKNYNFLISTSSYDASKDAVNLDNAGSIRLINGSTGEEISLWSGDKKDGELGKTQGGNLATTTITPLANSNYVVIHHTANNGTTQNVGWVRLFSGVDGTQVGGEEATVRGNASNAFSKNKNLTRITPLDNHKFVLTAAFDHNKDDELSAGSIRLIDGTTGKQDGETVYGENAFDLLGSGDVIGLSNNKYVVASPAADNDDETKLGSVKIFNDDGTEFKTLSGVQKKDFFGSGGLTALGNNMFVISSPSFNRGIALRIGSISIIDTNKPIDENNIVTIKGGDQADNIGSGGVTQLSNHNFVFASPLDDFSGSADVGSVQVVRGTDGVVIGDPIYGSNPGDMTSVQMIKPVASDYFILSQPLADGSNGEDAGKVSLIAPKY